MAELKSISGSGAEDLFIDLFADTFGAEKAGYLYSQYPFFDIYQNARFADFVCESGTKRIAIEIDDEASHNPKLVSKDKFTDDLLKQNSMIHLGWDVYRWTVRQMQKQPDTVKDELRLFLGSENRFKEIDDYLPTQRGQALDGGKLELREYQQEALTNLQAMRENKETIALLYQATGTGKTVTVVMDAQRVGGRTLFVAHTMELVNQAYNTFKSIWNDVSVGKFADSVKDYDSHVICGSIQSVALNLDSFKDDDFDYIIIDEAHHATADTYQKVLAYFKPKFILGLTATPERADDTNILEIFKNTAHKLDIQTAVEMGALTNVRCIRIHTNIDMTKVRFNSVQYNIRDLDVKICVTERNKLIVDTWLNYVKDKRTVVFCASVKHAEQIAELFKAQGVSAMAVSGGMKTSERNEQIAKFASGELKVLCACDLLNEGWDCPQTEVLFMARPTMSKVLYTQQLGRGMRLSEGKEFLMVFDFVDNASQYNAPYSMHRLFKLKDYHAGGTVLGKKGQREAEIELYAKGERPDAVIDYPVDATDYEAVDIFNWQEEAAGMISQMEFIRRVDVQSETIERYVREGKLVPDLIIPMSEHRVFKYFKEETLERYAQEFGWKLIDDNNRKTLFMEMVEQMDMSYSYKPVLLKAVLQYADKQGRVKIEDIVAYFKAYYEDRRAKGLKVEKQNSIFAKGGYTDKEAERNILSNPFKRFEDMNIECDGFSYHTSDFDVERDIKRERWLKENGYKNILRFTTNQIINEIHIVIRRIKFKLDIEKYSKQQLKFKGKQIRKDYVINVDEAKLHDVTLYYDYLQINEDVFVAYKFHDVTKNIFSDIRIKRIVKAPLKRGGDAALLLVLRALKSSVKLLVYCQTDFLVRYFNDFEDLSSVQQKELKTILQELRKHNYLFKYINCRRNASYYEMVQDERLILQELKSKVRQHGYSGRNDICEIEVVDYNEIFY